MTTIFTYQLENKTNELSTQPITYNALGSCIRCTKKYIQQEENNKKYCGTFPTLRATYFTKTTIMSTRLSVYTYVVFVESK